MELAVFIGVLIHGTNSELALSLSQPVQPLISLWKPVQPTLESSGTRDHMRQQ